MAHSRQLKEALALLDLPGEREMCARVEIFMLRSGFTITDLANEIGYSPVSLSLLLNGRYNLHWERDANTRLLRAKLLDFLNSAKFPEANPKGKLYLTNAHKLIEKAFHRALNYRADNHAWAFCFDGPPGTLKSTTAELLVRKHMEAEASKNGHGSRAYYIYCGDHNSPQELLKNIAVEVGVSARGYIDQLIKKIQFKLADRHAVFIFDEAQHLPKDTIERIRQLLDRPPYIGMLFLGSHDLQKTFSSLHMEQWRRRLVETVFLPGLTRAEAEEIILSEFGFTPKRKQIDGLIEDSIVPDDRRPVGAASDGQRRYEYERVYCGRRYEAYLSAGALFAAIEQAKIELKEAK